MNNTFTNRKIIQSNRYKTAANKFRRCVQLSFFGTSVKLFSALLYPRIAYAEDRFPTMCALTGGRIMYSDA